VMEPIGRWRLRGVSNLARTAGLLVTLSVSLAGCATYTSTTGTATTSPVETGPYPSATHRAGPSWQGHAHRGKCPALGNDMHAGRCHSL